jgi:DNA primase
MDTLNAAELKDRLSLVDLLANLGFYPVRPTGRELFFLSMLRDSDTKPSFTVNPELNVWYDHGLGKGGNIIDFGLAFWKGLTFREVLLKLQEVSGAPAVDIAKDYVRPRRRHAVKLPHYHIEEIKELGNNAALTDYLKERGVWAVAEGRLKEIYYYVEDEKKLRKYFFAAGWQNEQGAWEVRNRYFKGCLGHKDVTLIPGNAEKIVIFEGYFNYLSWTAFNPGATDAVLVLNSLSLLQAAIKLSRDYPVIDLFFDRDKAGHQASIEFCKASPSATDQSVVYDGFNDYNERLMAISRSPAVADGAQGLSEPRRFLVRR